VKKITVKLPRSQEESDEEQWGSGDEEWGLVCQVCGQGAEETDDTLLVCDGEEGECPNAYHTFCIGLEQPPNGRWLCSECQAREEAEVEVSSEYSVHESQEESDSSDQSCTASSDTSQINSESDEDDVSDPDAEYVPEEESDTEVVTQKPVQRPKLKIKLNRKRLRRIVPMNRTQRRAYIQKHVKENYQSETEPFEEAWIIFKAMQNQEDNGVLTRSQLSEVERTKRERSEHGQVTPEVRFRVMIENLVADETCKILPSLIEKGARPSQKQVTLISSRLVTKLVQRDKGRLRSDRRSLEKMKASIRNIWSCELSVEV